MKCRCEYKHGSPECRAFHRGHGEGFQAGVQSVVDRYTVKVDGIRRDERAVIQERLRRAIGLLVSG